MQGEIRLVALQLEGELFRLQKSLDNERTCIDNFVRLQDEILKTRTQLEQYRMCLDQLDKSEKLKGIKRRMMRGLHDA